MPTIEQALNKACQGLENKVRQPRLDAEVVLSCLLNKDRSYLIAHSNAPLEKVQNKKFKKLIKRRGKSEPLAYITGAQPFYSQNFIVNKNTLIPRPETEQLIDLIKNNHAPHQDLTIIDLGTGSGNIGLTLAKDFANSEVLALDIDKKALKIAQLNRYKLQIKNITFLKSNLLQEAQKHETKADIIVANLPYLTKEDIKSSPTQKELYYEPRKALLAKDFGLALIKKSIKQSLSIFKPNGVFYLEFHPTQTKKLAKWIKSEQLPFETEIIKDFSNRERFVILKFVE